jgi:hypothetical protein
VTLPPRRRRSGTVAGLVMVPGVLMPAPCPSYLIQVVRLGRQAAWSNEAAGAVEGARVWCVCVLGSFGTSPEPGMVVNQVVRYPRRRSGAEPARSAAAGSELPGLTELHGVPRGGGPRTQPEPGRALAAPRARAGVLLHPELWPSKLARA